MATVIEKYETIDFYNNLTLTKLKRLAIEYGMSAVSRYSSTDKHILAEAVYKNVTAKLFPEMVPKEWNLSDFNVDEAKYLNTKDIDVSYIPKFNKLPRVMILTMAKQKIVENILNDVLLKGKDIPLLTRHFYESSIPFKVNIRSKGSFSDLKKIDMSAILDIDYGLISIYNSILSSQAQHEYNTRLIVDYHKHIINLLTTSKYFETWSSSHSADEIIRHKTFFTTWLGYKMEFHTQEEYEGDWIHLMPYEPIKDISDVAISIANSHIKSAELNGEDYDGFSQVHKQVSANFNKDIHKYYLNQLLPETYQKYKISFLFIMDTIGSRIRYRASFDFRIFTPLSYFDDIPNIAVSLFNAFITDETYRKGYKLEDIVRRIIESKSFKASNIDVVSFLKVFSTKVTFKLEIVMRGLNSSSVAGIPPKASSVHSAVAPSAIVNPPPNRVIPDYGDIKSSDFYKGPVSIVETKNDAIESREITPEKILEMIGNLSFLVKIQNSLGKLYQAKSEIYTKTRLRLIKSIAEDEEGVKSAKETGASSQEINALFPQLLSNKVFLKKIQSFIDMTNKKLSTDVIKKNITDAINDPDDGILTLSGKAREKVRNNLAKFIFILSRGHESFINSFMNMVFTGPPGVGKTKLAKTVGFVMGKIGVLLSGDLIVLSPADMVGQYIGSTAIKTVGALMKGMENVVLIDEAYQIMSCADGVLSKHSLSPHGSESIVEIVNFLDKYVGLSIVIVAGYAREIEGCFFKANGGLDRRFPIRWELPTYESFELFNIFMRETVKRLNKNIFNKDIALIIYTLIRKIDESDKTIFKNQAGDMINLTGMFINNYYGDINNDWDDGMAEKVKIVENTLNDFLLPFKKSVKISP